jgi:Retroviral aspartyl protease./Reverse transcriptase (RNA-dependent DNA polymerase).
LFGKRSTPWRKSGTAKRSFSGHPLKRRGESRKQFSTRVFTQKPKCPIDLSAFCSATDNPNPVLPILDKRWYITVNIQGISMLALVDTGSTLSYISVHGVRDLQNLHLARTWIPSEKVIVANGSAETVNFMYDLPLEIQDHRFLLSVRYLPCLTGKLLLGLDAIQYLGLRMNGGDQTWHFPNSEESHPFESRIVDAAATTSSCGGLLTLSTSEKNLLDELLGKFQRMSLPPNSVTDLVKHHIDVQGHQPIRQKPYPVNPKLQEVIHKEVDKMLADGVIRKSSSGWSNPIVLVRKPDNTYRFCLDFRKLNNVTKKDAYPLPNMTSILDQLRSARYISKLDLTSAYWSIALDDDSCEKTAFAVPGRGLFEFVRMPFGLTNATASFQRLMDSLIGPELEPNVYSYLDDVIVVSDTITFSLGIQVLAKCKFCKSLTP